MNIDKLFNFIDDEKNNALLNLTTNKIRNITLNILKELNLSKNKTIEIYNKLKEYKYIDEMNDLKYGTYIRWIPIEDPTKIELSKGAIFCDMKINDDGVFCICKNLIYLDKYFQISMDKNLIFQKLTDQELILLSALDHLAK
jgi:hypothetical protein